MKNVSIFLKNKVKDKVNDATNLRDIDNRLFNAIKTNDLKKTINALEDGADVNALDENSTSPLEQSIYNLNVDINITKILIEFGADQNAITKYGRPAIKNINDFFEFDGIFNEEKNKFCIKADAIKSLLKDANTKGTIPIEPAYQEDEISNLISSFKSFDAKDEIQEETSLKAIGVTKDVNDSE